MSETSRILRTAARAATYHGLQAGPHFVDSHGRLDLIAAIYIGATGKTPHSFATPNTPTSPFNNMATALIETNEPVMNAIRAVSDVLPTDKPTDSVTGLYCPIEHLWYWQTDRQHTTGQPPTDTEIVGLLLRAARENDTTVPKLLFSVPTQRAAA
ncbi:hypothetical protein [Streptomyces sp. NPDC096351]|uniref:hypothetical protein n=1 Tax=Streptomyces sp. NPDC096351 TaxID=3366087 RepID=UPI0038120F68